MKIHENWMKQKAKFKKYAGQDQIKIYFNIDYKLILIIFWLWNCIACKIQKVEQKVEFIRLGKARRYTVLHLTYIEFGCNNWDLTEFELQLELKLIYWPYESSIILFKSKFRYK